MISLTANIAIPNINRLRVSSVQIDQDNAVAYMVVRATQVGGNIYGTFVLTISNGSCIGLRSNPAPTGPDDALQNFTVAAPTAFTDVVTAYTNGAGNLAAKNQAVETACISAGLLPAGTVS